MYKNSKTIMKIKIRERWATELGTTLLYSSR